MITSPCSVKAIKANDFWKGRRVFITGHTGFKGAWLSFMLSRRGAILGGFSLAPGTTPSLYSALNLREYFELEIIEDICATDKISKAIEEFSPEIVFHFAAKSIVRESYSNPLETYQTNVIGTATLMEALRNSDGLRAVLVATSDKAYENDASGKLFSEEDKLGGHDPYSSSKACQEHVVKAYRESFFRAETGGYNRDNMPPGIATIRAGNVIGGGDWSVDRLIPDFVRSVFENSGHLHVRNPYSVRPWQYVIDCLEAYISLAARLYVDPPGFSEAWNVGPKYGDSITVQGALGLLMNLYDLSYDSTSVQLDVRGSDSQPGVFEQALLLLDSRKANQKLDWSPKFTIDETIRATYEWYEGFYNGVDARELCEMQLREYYES